MNRITDAELDAAEIIHRDGNGPAYLAQAIAPVLIADLRAERAKSNQWRKNWYILARKATRKMHELYLERTKVTELNESIAHFIDIGLRYHADSKSDRAKIEELQATLKHRRIETMEEAAAICRAMCREFPACGVALAAINSVIEHDRAALEKQS